MREGSHTQAPVGQEKLRHTGIPAFGALAGQRFGYTGQAWLPSVGLWYYKARIYAPQIGGRFLQPDPIGYWDSPNLYAYVLNDPVNFVDPLGLAVGQDIFVTGILPIDPNYSFGMGGLFGGMASAVGGAGEPLFESGEHPVVVVTGRRKQRRTTGVPHFYVVQQFTRCPAAEAFKMFLEPGWSGPNAPRGRPDRTAYVPLTDPSGLIPGVNYITQVVNVSSLTIVNITERHHRYYPGTVTIRVIPHQPDFLGPSSTVRITGEGTGGHRAENIFSGRVFFGGRATQVGLRCAAGMFN